MTGVGVEQIAAHVGISFELRTSATAAHQDIRTSGHSDTRTNGTNRTPSTSWLRSPARGGLWQTEATFY